MNLHVSANRTQLSGLLLAAHTEISVCGRGTGKSFDIGFKMDQIVRHMPGCICAITGKSFGQLLTRTLPSSLKLLSQIGYQQGVNFVIGRRPPSHFRDSIELISKFDNVISFANGTRFALISQSEPGSGRGANVDYEIIDEALTIDHDRYVAEVAPTNRGNLEFFGRRGITPSPLHHGCKLSTSMPVTKESRWILDYADYYHTERGVRLLDQWNRVVQAQLDLLDTAEEYRQLRAANPADSALTDLRHEFRRRWREVERLRQPIAPFVSRDGVLFTVSNAIDNLQMLGIDYLLQNRRSLPRIVFMTEIMNIFIDRVEDGFYALSDQRHIYYDAYHTERLLQQAVATQLAAPPDATSLLDRDTDPSLPLEIAFDWGSTISLLVVMQERQYDFHAQAATAYECQTQINEFYVKPEGTGGGVMIQELIAQFTRYYAPHTNKTLFYYKDRYGDHRNPAVINAQTFNEQAIELLERAGWRVVVRQHPGMEPPQSDKYLLWGLILAEQSEHLPRFRINGDRCRCTLISMNNARVITREGQLRKDKSSERRSSGVAPEEATHFSDAVDKLVWTKYGSRLRRRGRAADYTRIGGRLV